MRNIQKPGKVSEKAASVSLSCDDVYVESHHTGLCRFSVENFSLMSASERLDQFESSGRLVELVKILAFCCGRKLSVEGFTGFSSYQLAF